MVVKDSLDVSELLISDKYLAVAEPVINVEDIHINRNWAEGWFLTLGGSEKSRFTTDNEIEILIDNDIEQLERLVQSINNSKSYIYLTQIEFDPDFVATFLSDNDKFTPKDVLTNALRRANKRGVEVKIILNENLYVPDSFNKIEDLFKGSGVTEREFKSHGLHIMHAKIMIADGIEAFVIGSPFIKTYWDTSHHLITIAEGKQNMLVLFTMYL